MPHFSSPLREVGLVGSKEERGTIWEPARSLLRVPNGSLGAWAPATAVSRSAHACFFLHVKRAVVANCLYAGTE